MPKPNAITMSDIETVVHQVRHYRVILDSDLARIYGVTVKRLNEQVRRNQERFPLDFAFQMDNQEVTNLRSQFATLSSGEWGAHRKYLPYVFTEHGAVMAANVLNSPVAVRASIQVVRAFIRLRELVISHTEFSQQLTAMEKKYDAQFKVVFEAIRQLMQPPAPHKRPIGFR